MTETPALNTPEELAALRSPRQKPQTAARAGFENRVMKTVAGRFEKASWDQCRRFGSRLGLAFYAGGPRRRELAIGNIQMALGVSGEEANRIARRSCQNWGMTTCEFLHLPNASREEICDYTTVSGGEHLRAAHAQGRGVVLLMAHIGNWEMISARLQFEYSIGAIVRPLSNAAAQDHMANIRRSINLNLFSKFGAARPAAKWLRAGNLLCILPDRHAGADGVLLPLFGRETLFEVSPTRLAMMNNSPIVPILAARRDPWLQDGRIDIQISPAFEIAPGARDSRDEAVLDGTRQVISALETMVRTSPDQWSWMLRRWRDSDAKVAARVEQMKK